MNLVSKNPSIHGISLQGFIEKSYDELVNVFGEPSYENNNIEEKVNVSWDLEIEDYYGCINVVSIYNCKDFDGGKLCKSSRKYNWHIGGHDPMAPIIVKDYLDFYLEKSA